MSILLPCWQRNTNVYEASSPNRPSYETLTIFSPRCRASRKKTVHEVLNFLKTFLESMSPKITQKTENGTVGCYRFG